MKQTKVVEFIYDGCDLWGYYGGCYANGRLVDMREIQELVGREALFEGLKLGVSFKVTMVSDITVENIP